MVAMLAEVAAVVLADAGPLIALARLEQLTLLKRLYGQIWVTQTVWQEATAGGAFADAKRIETARAQGWLQVGPDAAPSDLQRDALALLDAGERATMAQALHLRASGVASLLVMDDLAGRAVAKRLGLEVIGTVGVLLRAKERSLLPAVAPWLAALGVNGYFLSAQIVATALELAGEAAEL